MVSRPLQIAALMLISAIMLSVPACGSSAPQPRSTTIVLAAASLTEALTEAAEAFEQAHPNARIDCSFAGSQVLAAQIEGGAPAGLFLSADDVQMHRVSALTSQPTAIASGRCVVIAPADTTLSDATDALTNAWRLALAGPHVPAGRFARDVCEHLDILESAEARALSQEESVRGVLTRVAMGEADAGIVYATDARTLPTGFLRIFPLPEGADTGPTYLGAVCNDAPHPQAAASFLAFLTSDEGQSILRSHGFDAP